MIIDIDHCLLCVPLGIEFIFSFVSYQLGFISSYFNALLRMIILCIVEKYTYICFDSSTQKLRELFFFMFVNMNCYRRRRTSDFLTGYYVQRLGSQINETWPNS
uniref:Uncharacterized protein n=1 Tax=Setaria viridis TaxID=4556 RepID=A0A4U6VS49_SETVI|nr:hypothetical protein SEVIR_2G107500v2 [Setaria viridis]